MVVVASDDGDEQPVLPDLRELYATERVRLVQLASLLLRDGSDAEEVVQEAFVAAHLRWHRLRDPDRAVAYLRSAVLNGARSRIRHRGVVAKTPVPKLAVVGSAEAEAVARDEHRQMIDALSALPTRQRECLVLRFYLDLSEAEIAATLDISAGSVKTHTHRGLAALAARLEVEEER
jgi:RNA polymerase sigma-70 factor (sigma-E family)